MGLFGGGNNKRNPVLQLVQYLTTAASVEIDKRANPEIQLRQAIEAVQQQHAALSQQAAAVIGNQRQLEMKLNRQVGEVEKLQASARQAIVLADEARAKGDDAKAQQFEQAAQSFASQLVTTEQQLEDLKTLHAGAVQASEQAKVAVNRNAQVLQSTIAQRDKLLSQLEQAKMQEQTAKALQQLDGMVASTNAPTLDDVRDKIERRYAAALGSTELAQNSVGARMAEVQASTAELAGASRLEQIRASLGAAAQPQAALTEGAAAAESAPLAGQAQPDREAEPQPAPKRPGRSLPQYDPNAH